MCIYIYVCDHPCNVLNSSPISRRISQSLATFCTPQTRCFEAAGKNQNSDWKPATVGAGSSCSYRCESHRRMPQDRCCSVVSNGFKPSLKSVETKKVESHFALLDENKRLMNGCGAHHIRVKILKHFGWIDAMRGCCVRICSNIKKHSLDTILNI